MVLLNHDLLVAKYGSNLESLIEVDLRGLAIDAIDVDTFAGLRNLVYLWLSDNQISRIEPGTFAGLRNLSRLALHNNRLTRLAPYTFDSLGNLRRLALSHNQLQSIEARALYGLHSLEFLSLDHNRLDCLGPSLFADLDRDRLRVVSMFANPSNFKSFVRDNYVASRKNDYYIPWERELMNTSNVFTYDEFLAQFLGQNTFQTL